MVEFNSNALKMSLLKGDRRNGQVMMEYIIVFICMLGVIAIFSLCLYAVRQQSNRSLDLVASEYP